MINENCNYWNNPYTIEELEKLHTKQLLNLLKGARMRDWLCEDCQNRICKTNYNNIKNILATRPHILNKQESKALRKERKKKGK